MVIKRRNNEFKTQDKRINDDEKRREENRIELEE